METEYTNRYILTKLTDTQTGQLVELKPYYGTIKNKGTALNKAYFDTIRNDLLNLASAINTKRSILSLTAKYRSGTIGQSLDVVNNNFKNIEILDIKDTWQAITCTLPNSIKEIYVKFYLGHRTQDGMWTNPNIYPFEIFINGTLKINRYPVNYHKAQDGTETSKCYYEGTEIIKVNGGEMMKIFNPGNSQFPFFNVEIGVLE